MATRSDSENYLVSAEGNFKRIRTTHARRNPCDLIEHYTDVIAEAATARAFARDVDDGVPGIARVADRADRLLRTATRAQRGAVKACSLGVRRR